MADLNKTELTQNITRLAALWLDEKGFKPVETEVFVGEAGGKSWIADLAGISYPTQTELIDLKLLKRAPRFAYEFGPGRGNEYVTALSAWDAARAALPSPLSILIEVKTSAGDFRGDRKWRVSTDAPTNLLYVAMPEGMVAKEEWPVGWGVILFTADGARIRKVHAPTVHPVSCDQQLKIAMNLAIRRDHHTRYARQREWQKEIRISDNERKTVSRFTEVFRVVKRVMAGESVDDALRRAGIRAKLPEDVRRDLEALSPGHVPPPKPARHSLGSYVPSHNQVPPPAPV